MIKDDIFGFFGNSDSNFSDFVYDKVSLAENSLDNNLAGNISKFDIGRKNNTKQIVCGSLPWNFGYRESIKQNRAKEHSIISINEDFSIYFRGYISNRDKVFELFDFLSPQLEDVEIIIWIMRYFCALQKKVDVDFLIKTIDKIHNFVDGSFCFFFICPEQSTVFLFSKKCPIFFHVSDSFSAFSSRSLESSFGLSDSFVVDDGSIFVLKSPKSYKLYNQLIEREVSVLKNEEEPIVENKRINDKIKHRNIVFSDYIERFRFFDVFSSGKIDPSAFNTILAIGGNVKVFDFLRKCFSKKFLNIFNHLNNRDFLSTEISPSHKPLPVLFYRAGDPLSYDIFYSLLDTHEHFFAVPDEEMDFISLSSPVLVGRGDMICKNYGFLETMDLVCFYSIANGLLSGIGAQNSKILDKSLSNISNLFYLDARKIKNVVDSISASGSEDISIVCREIFIPIIEICKEFIEKYFTLKVEIIDIVNFDYDKQYENIFIINGNEPFNSFYDSLSSIILSINSEFYKNLFLLGKAPTEFSALDLKNISQKTIKISLSDSNDVETGLGILNFFQNFACIAEQSVVSYVKKSDDGVVDSNKGLGIIKRSAKKDPIELEKDTN